MTETPFSTLDALRDRARTRPVPPERRGATLGERAADIIAAAVGSWRFVLVQSAVLVAWLLWNTLSGAKVDPYPFILLNLLLSAQAAYTAPMILMSQNRQGAIDRQRDIEDFETNRKAEIEIETLHEKIDLLREKEIARLSAAVERLTRLLEEERRK